MKTRFAHECSPDLAAFEQSSTRMPWLAAGLNRPRAGLARRTTAGAASRRWPVLALERAAKGTGNLAGHFLEAVGIQAALFRGALQPLACRGGCLLEMLARAGRRVREPLA